MGLYGMKFRDSAEFRVCEACESGQCIIDNVCKNTLSKSVLNVLNAQYRH